MGGIKGRKIKIAGAAGTILLLAAGTTFAWFTAKDEIVNQMKLGHVALQLSEPEYEKNLDESGKYEKKLLPGSPLYKDLTISLQKGSQPAYIRIKNPKVRAEGQEKDWLLFDGEASLFDAKTEENWIQKGGYFYYTSPLQADTDISFLKAQGEEEPYTIKVPKSFQSEWMGETITLRYEVEAIQSKNITPDFSSENPWPTDQIEKYTTEK